MRVRVIVEPLDLPVTLLAIEGVGLGQRLVGVEPECRKTHVPRGGLKFPQYAPRDPEAAGGPRHPHPLDFARLTVDALQRAAADRFAVEPCDDEPPSGRRHLRVRGGPVLRRVVAALEPFRELAEIGFEAEPGRLARWGLETER